MDQHHKHWLENRYLTLDDGRTFKKSPLLTTAKFRLMLAYIEYPDNYYYELTRPEKGYSRTCRNHLIICNNLKAYRLLSSSSLSSLVKSGKTLITKRKTEIVINNMVITKINNWDYPGTFDVGHLFNINAKKSYDKWCRTHQYSLNS